MSQPRTGARASITLHMPMHFRWMFFDHVPPGMDLAPAERSEAHRRASALMAASRMAARHNALLVTAVLAAGVISVSAIWAVTLRPLPPGGGSILQVAMLATVPACATFFFWLAIALAVHRLRAPFTRRALNDMGHPVCLACGYVLRGLPAAEPCPECGAHRPRADATASE